MQAILLSSEEVTKRAKELYDNGIVAVHQATII